MILKHLFKKPINANLAVLALLLASVQENGDINNDIMRQTEALMHNHGLYYKNYKAEIRWYSVKQGVIEHYLDPFAPVSPLLYYLKKIMRSIIQSLLVSV